MEKPSIPLLIPSDTPVPQASTLSHRGRIRNNNEDRLRLTHFSTRGDNRVVLLAVLADGVGGHRGGEIAAEVCVQTITDHISACRSLDDPPQLLRSAFLSANHSVLAQAASDSALQGMATTCVCALMVENQLFLANLGDSRAYLCRPNNLIQLTHDHTLIEDTPWLNLSGINAARHNNPFAHVLSRYLGGSQPPEVDLRVRLPVGEGAPDLHNNQGYRLQSGEKILLCSDGLTNMLGDDDIHGILTDFSLRKAVQRLVLCALQNGGFDNVSVVLIESPE